MGASDYFWIEIEEMLRFQYPLQATSSSSLGDATIEVIHSLFSLFIESNSNSFACHGFVQQSAVCLCPESNQTPQNAFLHSRVRALLPVQQLKVGTNIIGFPGLASDFK
jgi:hypothetical protein